MSTRDLIMFAMSTLPRNPSVNAYIPPDGSEPIAYIGQMEPIVEWIMQTRKESLFDLVILSSKETYLSKQNRETAVQFFAKNICDAFETRISEKISVDESRPFSSYESEDRKIRFILVPMNLDQPMQAIQSTVEYIREWKLRDSPDAAGNFYLDIHGGPRDMDLIQNAIISLLKIDGIIPAGVYTGYFNEGESEFHHKDASYAYGMFDFVSAMNEFINYGHGRALKEYFDKTGNRSKEEIKVTAAIDEVSRGLELCDPEAYKTGLNSLNKALDALPGSATSELNIFREYIKDSFGDLLNKKKRTTLLIVKRCIEKELFQQALTFIESSMPAEIVEKKLLYYPMTTENYEKIDALGIKNHTSGSDRKYIFIDNQLKNIFYFPIGEANDLNKAVAEFSDHFIDFMSLLSKEKTMQNVKMQTTLGINENEIKGINTVFEGHDRTLLGYFLRMHKALKKCRNTIHHGDSNRPDFEKIQKLLKLYVAYGEALYSRAEKK